MIEVFGVNLGAEGGDALAIFDIEAVIVGERCGVNQLDDVSRARYHVLEPAREVAHACVALPVGMVAGAEVDGGGR
jgi:hypothetical protein